MAHGAIGHCQHQILASAIHFGHDIQINHYKMDLHCLICKMLSEILPGNSLMKNSVKSWVHRRLPNYTC